MRDLNEDSNSCSWSLFNGERTLQNGHYYNGFLLGAAADIYPGCGKDRVKQTMLKHEAIFKSQVGLSICLSLLYRILNWILI